MIGPRHAAWCWLHIAGPHQGGARRSLGVIKAGVAHAHGRVDPSLLRGVLSDTLEGRHALRVSGSPGEAGVEQTFKTDGVVDVLTLSGWVRLAGDGAGIDAAIELSVNGVPTQRMRYSDVTSTYDGEWRQLTVQVAVSIAVRHDVTARCLCIGGQPGQSAVFDRVMIVASDSVPQFARVRDERQVRRIVLVPDPGGVPGGELPGVVELEKVIRFVLGRLFIPIPNPTDPPPVIIAADLQFNGVSVLKTPGNLELKDVTVVDGFWRASIDPAGLTTAEVDASPGDRVDFVTSLDAEIRLTSLRRTLS